MIVDCHSCGATYNISDDKVRGRRVRVRCKTCGEGIIVDGAALDDATRVYSPNFEPDATRVYAPTFEPAAYSEDRDESTRVMSAGGAEWREPGPEDWTVNLSETEQRTMSLRDLVSAYNTGEVGDDAFVWRDGMTDWLPLRDVPEIKAALDSGESTRVMSQAALRAAAAGSPPSVPSAPPPLTPPPPTPPPPPPPPVSSPGTRAAPRAAAARAVMPPTPVTYAAPSAPPRALRAEPPPAASVEYAPAWPAAAGRGAAPARVRENRARTDLFGGGPDANAEDELLRSSSVPLEQYDEKPTGARNESSVLFSLDTLKAGARRGGATSVPPRMLTASPPTAADILGMTAGGALPGMDSTAMLLSAPRVEAPAPVAAAPVRDRDTTPPTMRNRTPLGLIAAILALALAVAGAAFFVLRTHASPPAGAGSAAAELPSATLAPAASAPTTPVATAAAEPPLVPTAPTEPTAQAPATEIPAAAPPAAAAPGTPSLPKAATAPNSGGSNLEAMKAAMRPGGADKPEKPEAKPADKGAKGGKVVLEEEPSGGSAPAAGGGEAAEPPAEEAPKPPFDTGAAKTALANAAAGAAGCKKADGPTGAGKVQVTFSPSGRATSANVIEGAFGGTPVGGCIAKLFRAAKVPAFSGDPVTVSKSFSVPE